MTDELSREELAAALGVLQEKGTEIEPALVDSLAQKIDHVVEQRFRAELALRKHQKSTDNPGARLALAIVSLALGIPLTAIAGEMGSLLGIVIAWVGIVLVNIAFNFGGGHSQR